MEQKDVIQGPTVLWERKAHLSSPPHILPKQNILATESHPYKADSYSSYPIGPYLCGMGFTPPPHEWRLQSLSGAGWSLGRYS